MRMRRGVEGQGALKFSLQIGRRNLTFKKTVRPVCFREIREDHGKRTG
jgi:hypothetical protein